MDHRDANSSFELDWRTAVGLIILLLLVPLSAVAGVGGGAVFVPVFEAVLGFGIREATALSQALICAGSFVSCSCNLLETNPHNKKSPLIDFPLAVILCPTSLAGVGIGVLLNGILPSYLISMLLVLLLTLLVTQSLLKGVRMLRGENAVIKARRWAAAGAVESQPELPGSIVDRNHPQAGPQEHQAASHEGLHQGGLCPAIPSILGAHSVEGLPRPQRQTEGEREQHQDFGGDGGGESKSTWVEDDEGPRQSHPQGGPSSSTGRGGGRHAAGPDEPSDDLGEISPYVLPFTSREGGATTEPSWGQGVSEEEDGRGEVDLAGVRLMLSRRSSLSVGRPSTDGRGGGDVSYSSPLSFFYSPISRAGGSDFEGPLPGTAAPSSWVNRRHAWLDRFLMHCAEGIGHPPLPSLAPVAEEGEEEEEGEGEEGRSPPKGSHPPLRRTRSLGREAFAARDESLLSAEEAAAILTAPPGRRGVQRRRPHNVTSALSSGGPSSVPPSSTVQPLLLVQPHERHPVGGGHMIGSSSGGLQGAPNWSLQEGEEEREGRQSPLLPPPSLTLPPSRPPSPLSRSPDLTWSRRFRSWFLPWGRCWALLPKALVGILLLTWVAYLALQLMHSLSKKCSWVFWLSFTLQLVGMAGLSLWTAGWLARKAKQQTEGRLQQQQQQQQQPPATDALPSSSLTLPLPGFVSVEIPVQSSHDHEQGTSDDHLHVHDRREDPWPQGGDEREAAELAPTTTGDAMTSAAVYQILAFTAGCIGGLLGLGGGVILSPMLLELGIQPQVSAATTTVLIFLSSSTALVAFASSGRLNLPYAGVYGLTAALASLFGALFIGSFIRRTGRVSLVVLSLATIMLIGGCSVLAFGIMTIVQKASGQSTGGWGPEPLCLQ